MLRGLACVAAAAALIWGACHLFFPEQLLAFPNWFWPLNQPWWWPFRPQGFFWRAAPLAVALAAIGALVAVAAFPTRLRPRWTLGLVLLGGLLLHTAILVLPERGLAAYAERIAASGHVEFFVRAAVHSEPVGSLVAYERHLRDGMPATFSRAKGPANHGFHVLLQRAAQQPWIRRRLRDAGGDDVGLRRHVLEAIVRRFGMWPALTPDLAGRIVPALLLMPLVSCAIGGLLPLPAFVLGTALFARRDAAVRLAVLAAAIPAVLVENSQLDGSVFPLLFLGGLTVFVYGWQQRRRALIVAAGVLAALYVYFTLGAVVLVALCLAIAGLDAVLPPRRRGWLADAAVYLGGIACSLLVLRGVLSFRVIDRYRDALSLQATWRGTAAVGTPDDWQWLILNSVEFVLTLGPVLGFLSVAGAVVALRSLRRPEHAEKFSLAVAATFLAVAIFGRNSEVYRLWAFWGPVFVVPALLATQAIGGSRPRFAATLAVAAHLLWVLPFATRFGWVG